MSFEETFKTSYSHGFESIYALETVDIRSVRRLDLAKEAVSVPSLPAAKTASPQLQLDLGPGFRNWMVPTFMDEPVQVLLLSRPAEKCLLDIGKTHLRDLSDTLSVGQGHRDEIAIKLKSYLTGKETLALDFGSCIRSLCPPDKRTRCFLLLESFDLEGWMPLSISEGAEIRRLTKEQKLQWTEEALRIFKIDDFLKELIDVFINPWIYQRKGLATEDEIVERLEKYSVDSVDQVLHFLRVVSSEDNFPLAPFLHEVERGIYAATPWQAEAFQTIVGCARSYFCTTEQTFLLPHLISLVEREMARCWEGYEEGFAEKAVRLSASFRIGKNERNILTASLSKPFKAQATRIAKLTRFAC